MNKETEQKIKQLQILEQNLQNILLQKQTFQAQLLEIDNALNEIKTDKTVYKIVGPIMILSNKKDLEKDLNNKKNILDLRIKNLEKHETQIKQKADTLRSEVMKDIEKK